MRNAKVKLTITILGIIGVAGLIFFLQNSSPVITLTIFGSQTIALPVAGWLIFSTIAGLITSIILQFLLGLYSRPRKRVREWEDTEGDFEFPEAEENRKEKVTSRLDQEKATSQRKSQKTRDTSYRTPGFQEAEEDWESPPRREDWNELDEEWNIEEPPRQEINDPTDNTEDEFYEVERPLEKTSQQGSVYSYRYRKASRESDNEEENNYNDDESSPPIYEANYRVIRPPLWNLPEEEEDDDDNKR